MTGFEAFMLLPFWARALFGFFVLDVIAILVIAAIHANQIVKYAKKTVSFHETVLQEVQVLNVEAHKIAQTLSLMLGMQISERDRRQAKEDEEATDKSNKKLSA